MTLQDIFDSLKYGELAQIFLQDEDADFFCGDEVSRRKMWGSMKLGLTDLHTRFLLRELKVRLDPVDDQYSYNITVDHAVSNTPSTEDKYLDDSEDTFTGDMLRIERVYGFNDTWTDGKELVLNSLGNPAALRTPNNKKLVIPSDHDWDYFQIYYRADHPVVDMQDVVTDPESVEINLPTTHLQALHYYCASRVLNPIGMQNEFHEGNEYFKKYVMECNRLENKGYRTDLTGTADERFQAGGWV